MRWFFDWAHGVADDVRKPINKSDYRIVALVAVLVDLALATIVLISSRDWGVALLCALFALPGALLAGGLCILRRQRRGAMSRRDKRQRISLLVMLVALVVNYGLVYGIPSDSVRLIVTTVALAVIAVVWPSVFTDYRRLQPHTARQRVRWTISTLAIFLVTFVALIELQHAVTSTLVQIIILIVTIVIVTIIYRSKIFGIGSDI